MGGTAYQLDDGSPYREFDFVGKGIGTASISVNSPSFQVLIAVERVDGNGVATVLDEQEGASQGMAASVSFKVYPGGYYVLIITGANQQPSGSFVLTVPVALLTQQATRNETGVRDPDHRGLPQLPATDGFRRPFTNSVYGIRFLENEGGIPHPGVDYNGPGGADDDVGMPYYAVARGLVADANSGTWGSIVIRHLYKGETVYSQYAHSEPSRVFVTVGQEVQKGQLIGCIGKKGTTFAHLHWEIRKSAHPYPTMASYWPTDVLTMPWLDRWTTITNRYYDPEAWVDNHGPYVESPPVAHLDGIVLSNGSSTSVMVKISNRGDATISSISVPLVQLGATRPDGGASWDIGDLAPGSSAEQTFSFTPGFGTKTASILTATISSANGQLRLRTRLLRP
ncbi:MAG: M23 family metallopeptidase [Fimbriimonadales bacterium]